MDVGHLLGSVLGGTLGFGRRTRKRQRNALRFLSGGRSPLLGGGGLLTAAGVAWGVIEALRSQRSDDASWTPAPASTTTRGFAGPPPLPDQTASTTELSPDSLRLLRLMVSAARADGELSPSEQARIVELAGDPEESAILRFEVAKPRPLTEIVADVTDPRAKEELYVFAFTIVRADEEVTGGERIFLAQLAHALGLDPAGVERIERETTERIDAQSAPE